MSESVLSFDDCTRELGNACLALIAIRRGRIASGTQELNWR